MKKLLTALLVVAMMLSLCTAAFAFSDTADLDKAAQGSIAKLNGLNIINGYPDGTFKPGNNITRAEFAKIACIAGGMGKSAEILQSSPSMYSDVAAGQWYTGYINLCSSQGWVKGYPDGTFRPNAQITYAEVITVLVRLLGYNDNLPGPWPVDYIAKAGALDITENISFDSNAPATRGDVAVMADATLDCDVVKWDNDKEDFENQKYTLLEDKFEAAVHEDYYIQDAKYDDGVWSIKIESTSDEDEDLDKYDTNAAGDPTHNGTWVDLDENVIVSDGSLPTGLGGKLVDILFNGDDEEVLYIEVTSTMVTVDGADWEYSASKKEYEIDGKKYDIADWTTGTLLTTFAKDGFYRAWINEDGEVYRTAARPTTTPAIVDEYKESTEKLTFKHRGDYYTGSSSIDFTDEDVLVEKDGKFVELSDLVENDVVYIDTGSYGFDYYLSVSGQITKSGKFQSYKAATAPALDQIRIDGTWYDVAPNNKLSRNDGEDFDENVDGNGLDDTYGKEIKYFLNRANQVAFVVSDVDGSGDDSNTIYGVVTDIVDVRNVGNKITKIEVMKQDGTTASYNIDTTEVELKFFGTYGAAANELDVDDFIKFSVNDDNEIDSLTILAYWDSAASLVKDPVLVAALADYVDADNSDYHGTITDGDTDNDRIQFAGNWYKITDETVVFNGYLDEALGSDDDEADIEKNADFVDWAESLTVPVTAYVQYSGGDVKYIFLHDMVSASDADYAVVLDNYIYDGDKWVDVDINGEVKSYELKSGATAPDEGTLYEYSISSNKFDYKTPAKFDPAAFKTGATLSKTTGVSGSVAGKVYALVTDVNISKKRVEINDVWYYFDDDTIIYDYSDWYDDGDDPVFSKDVADIYEDDYIIFIDNGDGKNIAEMFIIVNNIDE